MTRRGYKVKIATIRRKERFEQQKNDQPAKLHTNLPALPPQTSFLFQKLRVIAFFKTFFFF